MMDDQNSRRFLTSAMVAEKLGYTPDHVRRLILRGKIKAEKAGHDWIVLPKDIARFKRLRKAKTKE